MGEDDHQIHIWALSQRHAMSMCASVPAKMGLLSAAIVSRRLNKWLKKSPSATNSSDADANTHGIMFSIQGHINGAQLHFHSSLFTTVNENVHVIYSQRTCTVTTVDDVRNKTYGQIN